MTDFKLYIQPRGPTYRVYTDASGIGGGIANGKGKMCPFPFSGKTWDRLGLCGNGTVRDVTILAKEMYALCVAAKYAPENCCIRFFTDSQAAIAIFAKGLSFNQKLSLLCDDFQLSCRKKNVTAVLHYVHTSENPADLPSRTKWSDAKPFPKKAISRCFRLENDNPVTREEVLRYQTKKRVFCETDTESMTMIDAQLAAKQTARVITYVKQNS